MTDLFLGQTCTKGFAFISAGTAHTFQFPWQPDMVQFNNYTKWGTSSNYVQSTWWRGFPDGDALKLGVGTSPAANIALETTNGFTVANLPGGAPSYRALIAGVSKALPCVVTTTAPHGFQTDQIVRITDLGSDMPTPRGMDQLNNNRYKIVVLSSTTFSLKDVITGDPIDSTNYTTWVSGGRIDLESRTIALNIPQQDPYSAINPYHDTKFEYNPVTYQLTAGTAVMGADGDQFYVMALKFGEYTNLGDLLT